MDLGAALRSEAGRNRHDRAFIDLVGELSTRSEANCTQTTCTCGAWRGMK